MVDWSVCHNAVSHTSKLPSEHVFILSKTLFEIFEFVFLFVQDFDNFYKFVRSISFMFIVSQLKSKSMKSARHVNNTYPYVCISTCIFIFPFKKRFHKCGDLAIFAAAWSTFYYRNLFLRYTYIFFYPIVRGSCFFDIQYFI